MQRHTAVLVARSLFAVFLLAGAPVFAFGEQPATSGSSASDAEAALWSEVQKGNSVDDYEVYLGQYPNGKFAPLARSRLTKLKEQAESEQAQRDQAAWDNASDIGTEAGYQAYLDRFPKGRYAALAQVRINKLRKENAGTAARLAVPGQTFRDCADCPEMVVVPAGSVRLSQSGTEQPKFVFESSARTYSGQLYIQQLTKPKKEESTPAKYSFVATVGVFALGKTEVTQGQFKAIMGYNPSEFSECGDDCPVDSVSWYEAKSYIEKLSKKTGKPYRLPSEEEWEYACRAGTESAFCGGDDAGSLAWFQANAEKKTHSVASRRPNAWGLFDMSGNVWEWLEDVWHDSYAGAPVDGSAWLGQGNERVVRGGSWFSEAKDMHATRRFKFDSLGTSNNIGFRVARKIP